MFYREIHALSPMRQLSVLQNFRQLHTPPFVAKHSMLDELCVAQEHCPLGLTSRETVEGV